MTDAELHNLPRYDPTQSYDWNYRRAPDPVEIDVPPLPGEWSFCGRKVDSPLGIPAGPLLNGRWVLYYASLGFDVLTYKTVRSRERACYPLPNLQPVECGPLRGGESDLPAIEQMRGSWAVSFGMPSKTPDVWRDDVQQTRDQLPSGKLLSVSVVGTVQEGWTIDQLADDYARCARWAVEAGADAVETNFSCPNVATCDGQLYTQPQDAALVAQRVREAIGRVPLIVTKTYGTGKVLFMGTDSAWKWREGVEDRYHYRFWGQVARWMAYQRQMAEGQSMRLFYSPDRPRVDDVVSLNANVLDVLGGPLNEGTVVVQAISPSGKTETVRLQPGEKDAWGLFIGSFTASEPGNYRLVATCAETGASVQADLSVQGLNRERQGRLARFDVLEEITSITNGRLVPMSNVQSLLDDLAALPEAEPTMHRTRIWSHPAWCAALIVLMGVFWTGRKMTGAV